MPQQSCMHPSAQRLYDAAGTTRPSEVAVALDTTPQVVKNWESRGVSRTGALAAEKVFGCSVSWVLEGIGERAGAALPAVGQPTSTQPTTVAAALSIVLDALAACKARAELRQLLPMLVDTDAPAYRHRLAELLTDAAPSTSPLGAVIAPEHDERLRQMAVRAEEEHARRSAVSKQQRRRTAG